MIKAKHKPAWQQYSVHLGLVSALLERTGLCQLNSLNPWVWKKGYLYSLWNCDVLLKVSSCSVRYAVPFFPMSPQHWLLELLHLHRVVWSETQHQSKRLPPKIVVFPKLDALGHKCKQTGSHQHLVSDNHNINRVRWREPPKTVFKKNTIFDQ